MPSQIPFIVLTDKMAHIALQPNMGFLGGLADSSNPYLESAEANTINTLSSIFLCRTRYRNADALLSSLSDLERVPERG